MATRVQAIGRRTFLAGTAALGAVPRRSAAQATMPRLTLWDPVLPAAALTADGAPPYRAFHDMLKRLGFREDRDLAITRISGEAREAPPEDIARAIVALRPDAIVANGMAAAIFLAAMTATIPIVAIGLHHPVEAGLVRGFARPGGNLTGVTLAGGSDLTGMALQILAQCVPGARLGYLTGRSIAGDAPLALLRRVAARAEVDLAIELMNEGADAGSFRTALATLAGRGARGLCVGNAPEFRGSAVHMVTAVAERDWPAIYPDRQFVEAGGLISYGLNPMEGHRIAAGYVARILRGEKAGDLPVRQPAMVECVVNLNAAKAIGLALPPAIVGRATTVID